MRASTSWPALARRAAIADVADDRQRDDAPADERR